MKRILIIFLTSALPLLAFPQQPKKITGKVVDEKGMEIIGATIKEKGTSHQVYTDEAGRFSLEIAQNDTLEISYIGFMTRYWRAEAGNPQVIQMQEDTTTQVHIHYYEPQKRERK